VPPWPLAGSCAMRRELELSRALRVPSHHRAVGISCLPYVTVVEPRAAANLSAAVCCRCRHSWLSVT
jgi:hypothetical protein